MFKTLAGNSQAGSRSSAQIAALFVALVVFIVLLFANFAHLNTEAGYDKQYIGHAGELRVLSQRIAKNATEAAAGKAQAFKLLGDARNEFERHWGVLKKGDEATGLPPAPPAVRVQMQQVQDDWDNLRGDTDAILASQPTVLSLHQVVQRCRRTRHPAELGYLRASVDAQGHREQGNASDPATSPHELLPSSRSGQRPEKRLPPSPTQPRCPTGPEPRST